MSRKRRAFSAEFKTKVVLELLSDELTVAQVASKYEITAKSLADWKKQFLANASLAFDVAGATQAYKDQIEELQEENDALAKKLGKTIIERDWAVGKLKSLDLSNKKDLVDSKLNTIPMTRQCELIDLNRSTLYYQAKPIDEYDLKVMKRLDEIYTDISSTYGYRFMHKQLLQVKGGHMYLAAVIDWHSKSVLSWKLSSMMDTALATDVLKDAISKYGIPDILNTDQGLQYTSFEHTNILKQHNIKISMNGKGRSIDNIAIERFFRTLKYDKIYINEYASISDLKKGINRFMHFYNHERFHSALNYDKPMNVYLRGVEKSA